jgi:transposase
MTMGRRKDKQPELFIASNGLPQSPGHVFYDKLNALLAAAGFDPFVEELCRPYYHEDTGRPSLPPGVYFRMLFVGYFEGIDSQRGIAWRCSDSRSLQTFLGFLPTEPTPDHSSLTNIRQRLPEVVHDKVFAFVIGIAEQNGLVIGKRVGVDATTLEANAAMRSIVRRDTEETYQEFLTRLAKASGIETPTREDLARLDRKRKKKTSNKDWKHPGDPDAKVAKMKDGRTHLAHKAEHAVDLETGAIVAVTVQPADEGDTTTIVDTVLAALDQVEAAQADVDDPQPVEEIIADKGYHSNRIMVELDALGIRSYVAEPDRGRRDWSEEPEAQAPVYGNRRRIRGRRGRRLMRRRGEYVERAFAHTYDTGGMRRTHLRGHATILKRLLIHAGGFNLGLVMRQLVGLGTPRGLQDRLAVVLGTLWMLTSVVGRRLFPISASHRLIAAMRAWVRSPTTLVVNSSPVVTCTTGC